MLKINLPTTRQSCIIEIEKSLNQILAHMLKKEKSYGNDRFKAGENRKGTAAQE